MNRSPLLFVARFALLLVVLTVGARSAWMLETVRDPLRVALAHMVSWVLVPFGIETRVIGTAVWGETGAIEIVYDCDGVGLLMFFLAAALAFPVPRRRDLAAGLLWGVGVIGLANVLRLATLTWLQISHKAAFEFVHAYLFQGFLIVVTVAAWAGWVLWAQRRRSPG